uniref:SAYSvFN domain-containing protein n=1 Tax=Romanomermis culicivorax TaxID=13658 RepID=A0A915ISB1_ROMCU
MEDIKKRLEEFRQKNSINDKTSLSLSSASVVNAEPGSSASDFEGYQIESATINQTFLDWLPYFLLKLFLWLCLFTLAVYIQFGVVYCILTAFYLLWSNLADRKKSNNASQLSAYSVFNQNCQRLPGTLTAEQFENELMHKMPIILHPQHQTGIAVFRLSLAVRYCDNKPFNSLFKYCS